jgi:16S rRNA (cytidine1402-2'-O)-methyltransferase
VGAPPREGESPAHGSGGTLYVVSTPIGNLGDVTLRALEVLRAVPMIAAEDTRIARRLLARYEIPTRTVSFHARSSDARRAELLGHLRGGADLALVTDAGTPLVSDPGADLVAAWARADGSVVPFPGPSAALAALVASGIATPRWAFEGFLPRSGRERLERLARIAADDRATVLFEAANRLAAALRDLAHACGADRDATVCRELTKLHEQVVRATLAELEVAVADGSIPTRGEVAIVVSGVAPGATIRAADAGALEAAREAVDGLVAGGLARGEAARRVSASTGIPRRQLYGGPGTGSHAAGD